jgi:hypothetical protein
MLVVLQQAHGEMHQLRATIQQLGGQLQECEGALKTVGRERDDLKQGAAGAMELRTKVRKN